ncbi:hypothetical protein ACFLVO_02980 [Chloroflexota bacterium]
MLYLLRLIAEGGIYGVTLTVLAIGLASFYSGWLGMTVILLIFGIIFFILGIKQLRSITGEKTKITLDRLVLSIGLLLIAVSLMGLLDKLPFSIPKPTPDSYWVLEGAVGLVLTIGSLIWIKTRHR